MANRISEEISRAAKATSDAIAEPESIEPVPVDEDATPRWTVSRGGHVLMVLSTAVAVVVLLMIGPLRWSVPFAGSLADSGMSTSAGSVGRAFSTQGPKEGVQVWIRQSDVATLATELATRGWPSLALTTDGARLRISGAVANEGERAEVLVVAEAWLAGVQLDDSLVVSTGDPAHVVISVSQRHLILEGVVPNATLAEELLIRAGSIYFHEQIEDRLIVDPKAGTPLALTTSGVISNDLLRDVVVAKFTGIVGVDPVLSDYLEVVEPAAIETALNGLGPLRFVSGSAVLLSESASVLDQVAVIIGSSPQLAIEIGGHEMANGDAAAAVALSQSRAEMIRAELVARGVRNELITRGFGPNRLTAATSGPEISLSLIDFKILS